MIDGQMSFGRTLVYVRFLFDRFETCTGCFFVRLSYAVHFFRRSIIMVFSDGGFDGCVVPTLLLGREICFWR